MLFPRSPLPPDPQALLRTNTTQNIAARLQRAPSFTGAPPAPGWQPPPSIQPAPAAGGWTPPPPSITPQAHPGFTYDQLMQSAGPGIHHIMQMARQGGQTPASDISGPIAGQSGGGQPGWVPGQDIPPESTIGRLARVLPLPYGVNAIPNIVHSIRQGQRNSANRNWNEDAQNAPVDGPGDTGSDAPYYPPTTTTDTGGLPTNPSAPENGGLMIDPSDPGNPLNTNPDQGPQVQINPVFADAINAVQSGGQPPGAPTGLSVEGGPSTSVTQLYRDPMTGEISDYHDPNNEGFHSIEAMLGGEGELGGDPTNQLGGRGYTTTDAGHTYQTGAGGGAMIDSEGGLTSLGRGDFNPSSNPYGMPQDWFGGQTPNINNVAAQNSAAQRWMMAHGYGGQGRRGG